MLFDEGKFTNGIQYHPCNLSRDYLLRTVPRGACGICGYCNCRYTRMKRKLISTPKDSAKRSRFDQTSQDFASSKSIREQAEPYRLATAKFPIDALTSKWGVGSNRPIDKKHVQNLYRIFQEQGLKREITENHLLIACTRAEVEGMIDFLKQSRERAIDIKSSSQQPSFDDWMSVNESEAEIMAGQHHVAALKLYLQRINRDPNSLSMWRDQAWWICDIYDKGKSHSFRVDGGLKSVR
jgi:hypothetical protein